MRMLQQAISLEPCILAVCFIESDLKRVVRLRVQSR